MNNVSPFLTTKCWLFTKYNTSLVFIFNEKSRLAFSKEKSISISHKLKDIYPLVFLLLLLHFPSPISFQDLSQHYQHEQISRVSFLILILSSCSSSFVSTEQYFKIKYCTFN